MLAGAAQHDEPAVRAEVNAAHPAASILSDFPYTEILPGCLHLLSKGILRHGFAWVFSYWLQVRERTWHAVS